MIEATCTACGNINYVADADVPVGAKFVTCMTCKARVAVPSRTAHGAGPVEIADLPAPRRNGPLGGEASRPAPRSGLAAAELDPELPAPRGRPSPAPAGTIDLGDDFLSPPGAGVVDLPAPKGPPAISKGPPALSGPPPLVDLPAPKGPGTRSAISGASDLLAPKPGSPGITDLPAPKARPPIPKLPPRVPDVPAVKGAPPRVDLPAPGAAGPGIIDLPAPKVGGISDLPAPKRGADGGTDLPAPKGFFDDLPQPAGKAAQNKPDLLAPKGFFDDLPQPAGKAAQNKPDLPAPKGFFDDLPGRVNAQKAQAPEVPAPKGFFDDLPGRVNAQKAQAPEVPAPKGFFDDLPGRPNQPAGDAMAPKGFFDDLPQPTRPRKESKGAEPIDLSDAIEPDLEPLDLDPGPALDLDSPGGGAGAPSSSFDDLDLSTPTASPVRIDSKRSAAQPQLPDRGSLPALAGQGAEMSLELEEPRPAPESHSQRLAPKRDKQPSAEPRLSPRQRARRTRILAIAAVGILALGGGGFLLYRRHVAAQDRAALIGEHLGKARRALAASTPGHWATAARAAQKVVEIDPSNREALAIGAEAFFVSGLDEGMTAIRDFKRGRTMLSDALTAGVTGPEIDRAQALSALAAGQPDRALAKLQPLVAKAPKDARLALYLGWIQAARGDLDAAILAFEQASADAQVKIAALYGRAGAHLAKGDVEKARADFSAVLALAKDHIPSQVGLAAAKPASEAQQQEADLLAILARPDIATADPRAVARAWTLAAEVARRGGRLDVARERYNAALAIAPNDLPALTGLAAADLREGKLEVAAASITKALTQSANDVRAQLVAAEIAIRQNNLDDAAQRIKVLAERAPPPPLADQARLAFVTGMLLDAQGSDEPAADAYMQAAKLAGALDLTPTLAAVAKLSQLAERATAAEDATRAAVFRARADDLLGALADNAQRDPQLALTLGMAYLQTNDAAKAEPWLRQVTLARPTDAEATYQLAKAVARLGKYDEAVALFRKALDVDPARTDIGLELARTYETGKRDEEAGKLYDQLLATKDPNVELRAAAGTFYARSKQLAKAGVQGAAILKVQPEHGAGLYLKAEGMLAAAGTDKVKIEAAYRIFQQAVETDRDPQYLDGVGRAAEAIAADDESGKGDTRFQDAALRAYVAASELDPKMFNPLVGQGRLYVARREAAKAVPPLAAAYKLQPTAEVAKLLGLAHKELQLVKEAIGWLAIADRLAPSAEISWNLASLYRDPSINRARDAVAALTTATRLAFDQEKATGRPVPWLTGALFVLGDLRMTLGQEAAAADAWKQYIAREPPDDDPARINEVKHRLATELQRYR